MLPQDEIDLSQTSILATSSALMTQIRLPIAKICWTMKSSYEEHSIADWSNRKLNKNRQGQFNKSYNYPQSTY